MGAAPKSPARKESSGKIHAVELLRGLAAFAVMWLHFGTELKLGFLAALWQRGFVGVDVFFAISGFVIYASTRNDADPRRFVVRRLFRIVPLAWICIAAQGWLTGALTVPALASDYLFLPRSPATPPFYGPHLLMPSWTLSYEIFFYAVFGTVLCLAWTRRRRGLATVTLLLAILAFAQATLGHFTLDANWIQTRTGGIPAAMRCLVGNPILLFFPLGIGLAWLHGTRKERAGDGAAPLLAWGGTAACLAVAGVLLFTRPVGHGLTQTGVAAIFLCAPVLLLPNRFPPGLARFADAAGALSYGVYLIHPIAFQFLAHGGGGPQRLFQALSAGGKFAALVALTVLAAAALHVAVERPFQSLGRKLARRIPVNT